MSRCHEESASCVPESSNSADNYVSGIEVSDIFTFRSKVVSVHRHVMHVYCVLPHYIADSIADGIP